MPCTVANIIRCTKMCEPQSLGSGSFQSSEGTRDVHKKSEITRQQKQDNEDELRRRCQEESNGRREVDTGSGLPGKGPGVEWGKR